MDTLTTPSPTPSGTRWSDWPVRSEKLNELAVALSKAQGLIKPAVRDADNPFFKSSYADLESIDTACRTALTSNGFAILQPFETDDKGRLWLYTILLHVSDQHVTSRVMVRVPPFARRRGRDGNDEEAPEVKLGPEEEDAQSRRPQVVGSAITYYRRYAIAALCNVVAEGEDDDGEGTEGRSAGAQQQRQAPRGPAVECPKCHKPGRESKYPKPGATHYCGNGCKGTSATGAECALTFAATQVPA